MPSRGPPLRLTLLAAGILALPDLGGRTVVPGLVDSHCHPVPTKVVYRAQGRR